MKVKMICCVMAVLMLLGLCTACQPTAAQPQESSTAEATQAPATTDATAEPAADEKIVIAWAANMLSHEFMQRVKTGMESRCADVGAELVVGDGNLDVAKQISDIENFVAQQVNAIVVTPVDNKALDTAVAGANKANFPIIAEANKVAGTLTCVGANFVQHGYDTGAMLADLLPEGVQAKILID
ncbi:MAG TPA: substrate-binding domain-containing protein [Candidatus Limiplasma sp.]|nr:substrate-binding domain-containing protein [Candidatus Limiplasma sp.]